MDDFGIGAAALGAFRAVRDAMRGTGRSTRMLERYQEGDRIIFTNTVEGKRVERLAMERGKRLQWSVVDPADPAAVFALPTGPSKGRTIFDHTWLEEYYDHAIERATKDVRQFQDQSSGYGEPHRQTHEAARMRSTFRI